MTVPDPSWAWRLGLHAMDLDADGHDTTSSGSALTVKDEGSTLDTAVTSIDVTGAGATATNVGHAVTINVPVTTHALDDLSDVVITSAATADRLRFDGTNWVNSPLVWVPTTVYDPTTGNWLPLVDGDGNAIMAEV